VHLADKPSLRVAVLNACRGARSTAHDPFVGVAQGLINAGLPAVIAMQFAITDNAAIIFSDEFYGAFANSYVIEAALAEARKALFSKPQYNLTEWGTPVLFMRSSDGHIINPPIPSPPAPIKRSTPKAIIAAIIAGIILVGDIVGAVTNTKSFIIGPIKHYFFDKPKAILTTETLDNGVGVLTIRFENLPEGQREVPRIHLTISPSSNLLDRAQQPTGTLLSASYNVAVPLTVFNDEPFDKSFAPYIYFPENVSAIYAEFCFALVDTDMTKLFNKTGQVRITPKLLDQTGKELNITIEPKEIVVELYNPGTVNLVYFPPDTAKNLGEKGCRTS
jgi:CHAT domain